MARAVDGSITHPQNCLGLLPNPPEKLALKICLQMDCIRLSLDPSCETQLLAIDAGTISLSGTKHWAPRNR
jgi:hypothetical protein